MEARHLLKALKDDGWYLGDTAGASRQYVHKGRDEVITVSVRYTDQLGPATLASAESPGPPRGDGEPAVEVEATSSGFSAWSPDAPGCIASGETEAEARARLSEALGLHRAAQGGR